jgi:hypothetical protein
LVSGLALQFAELLEASLRYYFGTSFLHVFFIAGIAACGLLTLAASTGLVRSGKAWFVAVVVMHFFLGVAFLHIENVPTIDVLVFQQDASAALVSGHNPYAMTFPNVFGEGSPLYAPELMANGRVLFGFPYPPLILFLCLPSYLLTGDVRYAHLAATTLSGLLIGFSGRGLLSKLAAVLFLFSPTVFYVVQQGWTEPLVVLLLAIVLFRSTLLHPPFLALGLLIASKQYVFLAVIPATWLLIRERSSRAYFRLMLRVAAVSLTITLPLALWNFRTFFHSVAMVQLLQPFRPDALSIPALFVRMGLPQPPIWPAFAAAGVAGFFLLKRLPPSPHSFACCLAVIYMVFFTLNKQAFLNYYFLVGACLCGAVAAADLKCTLDPGGLLEEEKGTGRSQESGE